MAKIDSARSTLEDFFSYCADMVFIAAESGELLRRSLSLTRAISSELLDAAPQAGLAPLIHPDDKATFDAAWERLRAEAEPMAINVRLREAEGSFRTFQCTARWVPEREEVYGTLRDADERRKDDIKLKILKSINDNLPVCLWAIDERGVFIHQDGKACGAAGLTPGQFVGLNMFEIYPPEGTAGVLKALNGETSCFINEVDGRHWEAWYMPVKNERGEVTHVAGVSVDITEAKRTEQELRSKLELIQKQQQLIRSLSTPIIQVWDRVLTLPLVGMFDSARAAE